MFEISASQRTTAPYSAVCYITVGWGDGTFTRASGVVVGPNDVLTALHVVYNANKPGGWATALTVYPGADSSPLTTPYGTFSNWGTFSGRTTNWDTNGDGLLSDAEAQYDMALIGMKSRIGDVAGILPVASEWFDFQGTMVGYPVRGTGMMAENVLADASSQYGVYDISSSLGVGASGGPLLHTSGGVTSVTGTLSSGSSNNTSATYAGLFGAGTMEWLQNALLANDYLISPQSQVVSGTLGNDSFDISALAQSAGVILSDPGGRDAIRATSYTTPVSINLSTRLISAGEKSVTIDGSTVIEDLEGGTGADTLVGNAVANTLSGGAGGDTLSGGGGDDMIDGGSGIDIALFSGTRQQYTSSLSTTMTAIVIDRVNGRDGTDTLLSVERLHFTDVSLALDLNGSAGITAKILGAVFGKAAVSNTTYAGIGLKLLDGGVSYADLTMLALNSRLGVGFDSAAEINLLYRNLFGVAPSFEEVNYYQDLISAGVFSQSSLAVAAAELPLNAVNIGLTGLAASGLTYLPQV